MPTEKQARASRTNGARSRGPTSPEGKKNSSRNAYRHGLLAGTVVLEEESVRRFNTLLTELMDEYQPSTKTELILVETMAAARWRQYRTWQIQKTALDRDIALQDPALGPPVVRALFALGNSYTAACAPELLLRYDIAFDRQFTRALSHLRALRLKPTPTAPLPYVPEFPSGQTFEEQRARRSHQEDSTSPAPSPADSPAKTATAKRTRQVADSPERRPKKKPENKQERAQESTPGTKPARQRNHPPSASASAAGLTSPEFDPPDRKPPPSPTPPD